MVSEGAVEGDVVVVLEQYLDPLDRVERLGAHHFVQALLEGANPAPLLALLRQPAPSVP